MAQTAENVFRDFTIPGVPSSGANKVKKAEAREWGAWIEASIMGFQAGGGVVFQNKASMTLAYAVNQMAWVIGDGIAANNGIYQKQGGSGSGSWMRLADLPYSFIRASNDGAGTVNAILATSSIPIPAADGGALVTVNVTADNTGAATVSFNGGTALNIVSSSGNAMQAGYLKAGMQIAGFKVGANFRLLNDIASSSIVAAAEDAADRAEAAAAGVNLPAITSGDAGKALTVKTDESGYELKTPSASVPTRTALKAIAPTEGAAVYLSEAGREGRFIWRAGDYSAEIAADPYEGLYLKSDSAPASSGAWVRKMKDGYHQIDWWGARGAADILPIWNSVKALVAGATLVFGAATYVTSDTLAYEAPDNQPIDIRGVSETETIIQNEGTGFTFEYYGVTGGGNEVRGGGISHMKIEKAGTGRCSGVDIANAYRANFHHIDTDACGNTGIRVTGRGAGDTDATAGTRIYQNRSRNGLIGIQVRPDTSGGVCAAEIEILDNNLDGNATCGVWLAGCDKVLVRRNTITASGHTAGGTQNGRGGVYIEHFGLTVRDIFVEQNEFGNGIPGCTYDVIIDALLNGRFFGNRHIRNAGETGQGAFLLGFSGTSLSIRNVAFEHEVFAVASATSYIAFDVGGTSTSFSGNSAKNLDFLQWNGNTVFATESAITLRVNTSTAMIPLSEARILNAASIYNRSDATGAIFSFQSNTVAVGSVSVTGTTTAFNTTSDERLKTDIGEMPLDLAMQILQLVTIHDFKWKSTGEKDHGVFAQQLFEVYPLAVTVGTGAPGDENYTPWAVDYSKLITPLLRAVQGIDQRLLAVEQASSSAN